MNAGITAHISTVIIEWEEQMLLHLSFSLSKNSLSLLTILPTTPLLKSI